MKDIRIRIHLKQWFIFKTKSVNRYKSWPVEDSDEIPNMHVIERITSFLCFDFVEVVKWIIPTRSN